MQTQQKRTSAAAAVTRAGKIDVHAHFIPDFYEAALKEAGHVPGPDGMPGIPPWGIESHLRFMDQARITKSILSISSPGVWLHAPLPPTLLPAAGVAGVGHQQSEGPTAAEAAAVAASLARRVNDYAAGLKKQYPERIGFFASLPLPDVEAAVAEVERCFGAGSGLRMAARPDGVAMLSNYYGMYLGHPALAPVYDALERCHVRVIFEHPTTPCTQGWFHPAEHHHHHQGSGGEHKDDDDKKKTASAAERVLKFQALNRPAASPAPEPSHPWLASSSSSTDTTNTTTPPRRPFLPQPQVAIMDFPFDTARAVSDLILSSVPQRYPTLQWIIPHAGGAFPAIAHRLIGHDLMARARAGGGGGLGLSQPVIRDILQRQFYFDVAGPVQAAMVFANLLLFPTGSVVSGTQSLDVDGKGKQQQQPPPAAEPRGWITHERILWGSDVPFTPVPLVAMLASKFDDEVARAFREVGYVAPDTAVEVLERMADDVRSGNAEALLAGNEVFEDGGVQTEEEDEEEEQQQQTVQAQL